MDLISGITAIFGFLMSLAYLPQAILIASRGRAKDVSILMLILVFLGSAVWTSYGLIKGSKEILFMNGIATLTSGVTIILWFVFNPSLTRFYKEKVFLD